MNLPSPRLHLFESRTVFIRAQTVFAIELQTESLKIRAAIIIPIRVRNTINIPQRKLQQEPQNNNVQRLVRVLYKIRKPHCRQRTGSPLLIIFFAPQSPQRYSTPLTMGIVVPAVAVMADEGGAVALLAMVKRNEKWAHNEHIDSGTCVRMTSSSQPLIGQTDGRHWWEKGEPRADDDDGCMMRRQLFTTLYDVSFHGLPFGDDGNQSCCLLQ